VTTDQCEFNIIRDSPSEKRQTLEFNLEAASVNSNIFFMISGSAILSELVTVTSLIQFFYTRILLTPPPKYFLLTQNQIIIFSAMNKTPFKAGPR